MTLRRLITAVSLSILLAACAAVDSPGMARATNDETAEAILVMLRMPPQHFRPDVGYAAGYASRGEREALRRVAAGLAREHGLAVVDDWPMPALGVDCFVMRSPSADATADIVDRLGHDARVESVQVMHVFRTLAQSHSQSLVALQPTVRAWRLNDLHRIATGRGVRIAAVDTGVDGDHPDLKGQVILQRNFVDASEPRAEAHGTAVAGIIAARADVRSGIVGIAPEASLLALRACWEVNAASAARCSSFTLAKALQFAIDERAQVINLSLTGPPDPLLARLLGAAMARGVTVVAAVDRRAPEGGFPASQHGVLPVDTEAGDSIQRALLAPGVDIPAPQPGGRWAFVSGASFAAAEVSGVVALLRELVPALAPDDVRHALVAGVATGSRQPATIDAYAAVERTADACACAIRNVMPPVH